MSGRTSFQFHPLKHGFYIQCGKRNIYFKTLSLSLSLSLSLLPPIKENKTFTIKNNPISPLSFVSTTVVWEIA